MSGMVAAENWRAGSVVDGRYRVVGELGRGGMGVVHRVRHLAWGIDMAVKSARTEVLVSPAGQELFVREAEAWVSLGLHPHVCTCYYVRVMGGVPRVFAEYVPGGSLRDWLRDGRLYAGGVRSALTRILDVAIQVARGLEHAHARGLVHQDVKPANVLLDRSGTAKITDFGLAHSKAATAVTTAASAPADVSILVPNGGMTPAYASPEQVAGRRLGRRSDVYSFAVSVLELFTGGVRWEAGPVAGAALSHYLSDPGNPVPVPPPLAELLGHCLRPDPADRPSSMADIAERLVGIHEQATGLRYPRPASREATLRADELNNRGLSLLDLGKAADAEKVFAEALAVDPHHVGAVYNAGLLRWRGGAISDVELVAQLDELSQYEDSSWSARQLLAQVHLERGDLKAARALLDDLARERPDSADLLEHARAALSSGRIADARCVESAEKLTGLRELQRPPVELLARHEISGYWDKRFTPDGRLALTGHWDGNLRLWNVAGDKLLSTIPAHRGQVMCVDIDAAGHHALSTGYDAAVRYWDLASGRCLAVFPAGRSTWLNPVRLSANGQVGVWVAADGRIEVWNMRSGVRQQVLHRPWRDSLVDALYEVSADGKLVLTAEEGGARISIPALGQSRKLATEAPSTPRAMCFSADGTYAAVSGKDRTIRIWDLVGGRCVRTLSGHTGAACTLALSKDLRYLLSASSDNTVRFWELSSGRCLRTFTGHGDQELWVTMPGGDARTALSIEHRMPVLYSWRLPEAGYSAEHFLSRPHRHAEVIRLGGEVDALLADARQALSDSRNRAALDLLTRARAVPGYERAPQVLAAWRELGRSATRVGLRAAWSKKLTDGHFPFGDVVALDLSADARLAVTGHHEGAVRIWDLESGKRTQVLTGHERRPSVVALSSDGERAQCYGGGLISLWQVENGKRKKLSVDIDSTRTVRFIDDGRQALFGEHGIQRWDLKRNRSLHAMAGRLCGINEISLCADERLAAVGDSDGAVCLWDLERGGILRSWEGHAGPVLSVCLSRDGRRVLSTSQDDPVIRLWDASADDCVREFEGHEEWIFAVRFTPDGRFAFSAGEDTTVRLWDVESGRCLHILEGHQEMVRHLELSSDLRRLISAGDDGLRLWDLDWDLTVGQRD